MRILSFAVGLFALASLATYFKSNDIDLVLLGVGGLICAYATYRAARISTFLKIFIAIFSTEAIVFGLLYMADSLGFWPPDMHELTMPSSVALTVALFSILVFALSHMRVVRQMTRIADRFFQSSDMTQSRIWPLPFYRVMERRLAIGMVVFLVLLNQAQVLINVRLSFFSRDWFNAIQKLDQATFWSLLLSTFLPLAVVSIIAAVTDYFVRSMLVIRWRRWLTSDFLSRWLDHGTHYRMALTGGNVDNPDQRISEDVNRFIDGSNVGYGIYSYSILLISTLSSLVSFAIILWNLSADFTIPGTTLAVPGFLFWVALIYAGLGTIITHLIGRALVSLNFIQQRFEANFRFALARLREYSEQVALLGGEGFERHSAMRRFGDIFSNYLRILNTQKRLLIFTSGYGQISPFIPYIVAAPFYFARKIELGVLTQTAQAFGSVNSALNFFVNYYTFLADFRSVLDRLVSFDESIERARALNTVHPRLEVSTGEHGAVSVNGLDLVLPDGRRIMEDANLVLSPREPALLVGPSGAGKSTLLRAISGIWPFGSGQVLKPGGAKIMLLPQKPYIPIGSLRAAITYPFAPETYGEDRIRTAMMQAQLGSFIDQLDTEDICSQRLSGGEQQRLSIARALLAEPDWLFLDEATASLDEASESAIYRTLAEVLPGTTLVSIGHRSTLAEFHKRRIEVRPGPMGLSEISEPPRSAAAE